ncbi:MAG: hypothetical protein ACJAY1_000743 [Glaciecola sp.]|jgi:hypothetical protein
MRASLMSKQYVVTKSKFTLATVLCCSFYLTACNGSSNDGQVSGRGELPPPFITESVGSIEPLAVFENIELYGDSEFITNGSYGFAVTTNDNSQITAVNWQQLSGPELTLLAKSSQTIGFDALEFGDYVLQADVTINDTTQQITYDFSVQQSQAVVANLRLDHTVTERAKVSLRVDSLNNDISTATVVWKQVAGPAVLDFQSQENRAFFSAPAVNGDQIIQFETSVTFSDGSSAIDTSIVTINDTQIIDDAYFPNSNIIASEDVFSFNKDSPFKSALESCIYTNTLNRTCTFGTLPIIGQEWFNPTIDNILDRTLVSHDWMGQRFRQYLFQSAAGPDMLKLLRGVTAVVISYDVRPSFYWAATGAIYLDASNFWVTPEERDTLNEAPDFRSGFGGDLRFRVLWRYVKDNAPYMPGQNFSSAAREMRTFDVLEADISWLMYHELGHANDFFPSDVWAGLSSADDPLSFFRNNGANSDIMISNFPLTSSQLKGLAQVSFSGETANTTQRSYVAGDIESFFTPDIASSYYSYLNEREDFATLFERFMMQHRLGASADIGIVNTQNNPDFLVTWGQRDRFNHSSIQARTRFTVANILPELGNIGALQAELPDPIQLQQNVSWFSNIDLRENVESQNSIQVPYRFERTSAIDEMNLHIGRPALPN